MVFPGSFRYWRRSVEFNLCVELARQLAQDVQTCRVSAEIVMGTAQDIDRTQFFNRANGCINAKRAITTLIRTLEACNNEELITPQQTYLLEQLQIMVRLFEEGEVGSQAESEITRQSLWEFIEQGSDERTWIHVVFADYPSNEKGMQI